MANTSSRTLRLLSLLQTHRYWPGPELAERLEVSPRTLRRDVDRLRELGYPVEASRGVDGGYQLAAGAALPPLVVDDEEAVALAVGMRAATQGAVAGIEEPALRALTKVVQVMPPRLRKRVDALQSVTEPAGWSSSRTPPLDPESLIVVAQACRDTERLEFAYTARDAEPTERHVEPHRLVPLGRRWYLVAYDLDRHDWRSFRFDRLSAPHRTGARFRPRELPTADAADFVKAGLRHWQSTHEVDAVIHAPAGSMSWMDRWATVTPLGPDRCAMRLTTDDLNWAAFALGSCGVEFEVRSPPELVVLLHDWAARFSRS
ncbi:YafY family protein [Pseudonocardia ailaonensis]|uniref:YafY family protein n=1 Tax=Pseudonocardia ailaonensis TaxID=367279 RepID=A0ABN2MYG8_9PSEU